MSGCADDRFTDEQLDLWANWDPEPPGVDPSGEPQLIGPHMWIRKKWIPIHDLEIAATYQAVI